MTTLAVDCQTSVLHRYLIDVIVPKVHPEICLHLWHYLEHFRASSKKGGNLKRPNASCPLALIRQRMLARKKKGFVRVLFDAQVSLKIQEKISLVMFYEGGESPFLQNYHYCVHPSL